MEISSYQSQLQERNAQLAQTIETDKKTLMDDYLNRFKWDAGDVFKMSFKLNFLSDLLVAMETKETELDKAKVIQLRVDRAKNFLYQANFRANSTSQLSNISEMFKAEVYAEFLNTIQYYKFVKQGLVII